MKAKITFMTMAISLMAIVGKAQSYMVTPEHVIESKVFNMEMRNIMELRDGSILANVQIFAMPGIDYGCVFYKIKYDSIGASIIDSVFIEDHDMSYSLLERNPFDDNNVYAKIVCDYDNKRSDLRISFFDDNLNFQPEKEITIQISDTLIVPFSDSYILDKSGEMLIHYKISSRKEHHIVKMRLDGTETVHKVLPYNENIINSYVNIDVFNENPAEYCMWGLREPIMNIDSAADDTLRFIVLDSMLNVKRTMTHSNPPFKYHFSYGSNSFQYLCDTTFLFLTLCDTNFCTYLAEDTCVCDVQDYSFYDGVCLSRCGKSDAKNFASRIQGFSYPVFPMEVNKSDDDYIYTAFYGGGVTVAKLTTDMVTIWESKRSGGTQYFDKITPLEKGGVAVGGLNVYYSDDFSSYSLGLFFVIFKDGTFSVPENKAEERPYTFYPNPANEEITLSLSPEVEATMVEIYDIQGRMVRSQQSGFGTISMHGLPAGTYALRVSMKDGKQYTSAVVKK